MSDYLDVRMLTNMSWVALGHKADSSFGMVCKNTLKNVKTYPKIPRKVVLLVSLVSKLCYRRPLRVIF